MAGNATPQFVAAGNIGFVTPTAANTKSDGAGTIGTDIFLAFTAGSNGSLVEFVRFNPIATVAATATTPTTARIFWSTSSSGAVTASTVHLLAEVALPAATADHSTNPCNSIDVPINMRLPANATILITNHVVPAANTGWITQVVGGDF